MASSQAVQVSTAGCDVSHRLSPVDRPNPIEQTIERLPSGTRRLAAKLRTPVRVEALWRVLTDYEHLSDFIPNLSVSELLERSNDRVMLRQVGSQRFIGLNFSAEVHLELIEDISLGELRFALKKGDFRRFDGAWKMQDHDGQGSCIFYELIVQGCIGMPVSLIEQRLKDDLTTNLLAVEREAVRRTKQNS